nr:uncharacterized protein LOC112010011 [Quercus suber]
MAVNQTLKELAAPDLNQQPLCITFPTLDATTTFELKSRLIHLLPTFHGLAGENPHKHLKELHVVCTSNMQTVKACGICLVVGHLTDMCPTLQEEPIEQVNVAGGFPEQSQRKYDPYSSTYNPGWRDHPNLSYGNPQETKQFQHEARANIQSLDNQIGQMATAISWLEAQSLRKLPSQMVLNPRENASTIVLRSGKEVEILVKAAPALLKQENEQNVVVDKNVPNDNEKLKGCEKVRVGENVSAVIQRKLFAKCKDPAMFTIPCTIGNTQLEKANVMPYSIYVSLKLGPLNKTSVVIQLADRSIAYPKGVVKDVLVQVNDLVFPADFYVLDIENGD